MRDLLIITPSRGRPDRLATMLNAALDLSEAQTDVVVGVDEDDPARSGYCIVVGRDRVSSVIGPRMTVSGWTNHLAGLLAGGYGAVASLGDDHVPRTQGWDRLLLEAIAEMGGTGFAYGNDLHQGSALATSVVVSSDVVRALGWLMLPALSHFHVDDVWVALGRDAGCLAYLPGVVIEHVHPAWGGPWDDLYASEAGRGPADQAAFTAWWYGGGKDADVTTVAGVVAAGKAGS